jgi:predicted dehydrogenase
MKRKIAFGLIGCGEISVQTAKALAQCSNAEIAVVQDVSEEMARDLADKYGVPYCLAWDDLLSRRDVDAVYVATPHYLHKPAALAALAARKHVVVEKPISTTLADADAMIDAARTAGLSLSVCYTSRYTDRVVKARDLVAGGAVGKVVGIDFGAYGYKPDRYWTSGWTGRVQTDWRMSKEKSGGGVFLMNLIHTIDYLRFVTGLEVSSVAANYDTFKTKVEVEDYLVAILRYDNGAIGAARTATFVEGKTPPGGVEGDRIIGLKGQIFLGQESIHLFVNEPYASYEAGKWHQIATNDPWGGRKEFFSDFAHALQAGRPPAVTGLDGRKSLEVCVAAYRSGASGQVVRLPLVE